MTCRFTLARSLIATALAIGCLPTFAQYQWRDENGRMVYSDKAPPIHIKPEQVIRADSRRPVVVDATKAPTGGNTGSNTGINTGSSTGNNAGAKEGSNPRDGADGKNATATAKPEGEASKPPLTQADRDMEQRRKQQEQANADKKRRDQAELDAKLGKACEEMQGEIRTLESGMRIARVNAQGEREYLSDEDRASRIESMRRSVKDCKAG